MVIHEGGWIDLKKVIEYIARETTPYTLLNFEDFAQTELQNKFPELYRYVYRDSHGNIRINKNVFEHVDEVVQYLPLILKLDERTEYGVYFGNTLAETFEFTRHDDLPWMYDIIIHPVYQSEKLEITFTFADGEEKSAHDEQKSD